MRTVRPLVPLAALAVLLGACSPSGDAPDDDARSAGPTKVRQDAPTPTDEPDGRGGAEAEPAGDLAACIEGEWDADPEAVVSMTRASMAMVGAAAEVTASGSARATIADGTTTTVYEGWTAEVLMDVEGIEIRTISTQDGVTTQGYVLDGDRMLTEPIDMSASTMVMRQLIDGVEQDTSGYTAGFEAGLEAGSAQGGEARVTCTATTLTLVPVVFGSELPEMSARFTRR